MFRSQHTGNRDVSHVPAFPLAPRLLSAAGAHTPRAGRAGEAIAGWGQTPLLALLAHAPLGLFQTLKHFLNQYLLTGHLSFSLSNPLRIIHASL